jgi:diguanylate cyclase (GGDEF)-like protein
MTEEAAEELRHLLRLETVARQKAEALVQQRNRELKAKASELDRLMDGERRARHQVEVLRSALQSFTRELAPRAVLELVGTFLRQLVPHDGLAALRVRGGLVADEVLEGMLSGDVPATVLRNRPTPWERLIGESQPMLCVDVANAFVPALWPLHPETRSWLVTPMRARDRIQGWIVVESRTPGAMTEAQLDLAEALANEAAIALDNANLFGEVQRLSVTDALTGLANRRRLGEFAHQEFQRAVRHDLALCVIMLDLDFFKQVNDEYGHAVGDRVLASVGAACRAAVRATDVAARYGGEELCFLLLETDALGGHELAERLRVRISRLMFTTDSGSFHVTASLGVAQREYADASHEEVFARADEALYQAKRDGRDKVVTRRLEGRRSPTARASRSFFISGVLLPTTTK